MVDPTNITNAAVQLTAEQMTGSIEWAIAGLFISIIFTLIGIGLGKGARNEAKKVIGNFMGVIGIIGDGIFLIKLSTLLFQLI
jgi:hypothetical protein